MHANASLKNRQSFTLDTHTAHNVVAFLLGIEHRKVY